MEVLITLGSNIDRERNIQRALAELERHPRLRVLAVSPVYVTPALGADGQPSGQADFANAAVRAETDLEPAALRQALRAIESAMGRVRTQDKFAPRPIDLDLAFYGREIIETEGRSLPDPDVLRFAHVAVPLADVAGEWVHPQTGQTLAEIAAALTNQKVETIR
ncbi:2-amino-4-hydroxy-6-hydroxymethyldihydropteridine diphosphokinase [Caldilinea sp.]|uniref:2-amino-4-hydroxy-6- hydroxymethyldihydropteridine diphosphokinase n=1 Tax=Caldilinea sp. TaxID=2293560 RepID=UPI0021DC8EAA|nr:2-amino-4-hydroxy-6-hydroxymethyldihydropteridine diphosphokinase [Caldilinea sp.]GIV68912.1 MAG: 2-amino-4-hydroxy-6-hydroxymethyldihydropteridine diphosphokinase [Caldilinea sp.]